MNKDEILKLADKHTIDGGAGGFENGRYKSIKEARENSILAFANAIADLQREELMKMLEAAFFNHDADGERAPGEWERRRSEWISFKAQLLYGTKSSPESDIEQARRLT